MQKLKTACRFMFGAVFALLSLFSGVGALAMMFGDQRFVNALAAMFLFGCAFFFGQMAGFCFSPDYAQDIAERDMREIGVK